MVYHGSWVVHDFWYTKSPKLLVGNGSWAHHRRHGLCLSHNLFQLRDVGLTAAPLVPWPSSFWEARIDQVPKRPSTWSAARCEFPAVRAGSASKCSVHHESRMALSCRISLLQLDYITSRASSELRLSSLYDATQRASLIRTKTQTDVWTWRSWEAH